VRVVLVLACTCFAAGVLTYFPRLAVDRSTFHASAMERNDDRSTRWGYDMITDLLLLLLLLLLPLTLLRGA